MRGKEKKYDQGGRVRGGRGLDVGSLSVSRQAAKKFQWDPGRLWAIRFEVVSDC